METFKNFVKNHQVKLVLVVGYVLVASIAFMLGRIQSPRSGAPEIKVEEVFSLPKEALSNYSSNVSGIQSSQTETSVPGALNCEGQIKGSSSFIYHMPGGSFYNRTTKPIRCFATEAEALTAGFRKSSN